MVKKLYSLLFAICLLIPLAGLSQTVPSYAFQATTAAYDTVVQGTALTTIATDDSYAPVQLPFDFKFAETTYPQGTNFYVCSNGYITIGSSGTSSTPSLTSSYSFISPLGHDLKPGTAGVVSYAVTGTAPNQVLTIQWEQFQSFSGNNYYNFQVKLHETTNVIEFCYGPITVASSKSAIVGLFDVINSEKLIVRGSGSWSTFTASSTVTTNTTSISTSSHPDSGLVYTFTPPIVNCPRVSNLTASNYGPNSFDVTWHSEGSESSWILSYMPVGDSTSLVTTTATDTFHSIQGLTANTAYLVSVAADCGVEQGQNRTITAYTLYTTPATMPYVCDFEDESENSNWTLINDSVVNAWHIGNAVYAGTEGKALYISNDNGVTNAYNNSEPGTVFASRDITLDTNYREYALTFDYKGVGESTNDYLKVWFSKAYHTQVSANSAGTVTSVPGASYLTVGGSQYLNRKDDWSHANLILDRAQGWGDSGLMRLYLMWRNNGSEGSNPPIAIDNITLKGYSCVRPQNLATIDSAITQTSVTATWSRGESTDSEWQVCIVATGGNPDLATPVTVTDTTHLFDELTASTDYTIYIRTVCGTETSAWTSVSCRTACSTYMIIPFSEKFDNYGTGSSAYPDCWTKLYTTSSPYPYLSSSAPYSGTACLQIYSTASAYSCAIAPQIDTNTNPLNTLMVSFRVKKTSVSNGQGALQLGVMTDPTDITTFQTIKTWTGSEWESINTWYEVEEILSDITVHGSYLALRKPGTISGYTYIDNFAVSLLPTCLKPLDVAVSSITATTASVEWVPQGTATEWDVAVVPTGVNPETVTAITVYSHPYTITELTPNTMYDVYVRANCGGGEVSVWSNLTSFQTRCLPTAAIPYVENFDTYGTGTSAFPDCWTRSDNATSTTRYPYINSATATDSGNVGVLYFYSTSAIYSLATSQALDLSEHDANTLMLSFKAKKTSASYGRLDIGVMTDPGDLNTLTVLKTIYPSDYPEVSEWTTFNVPITEAYDTVYLAFYMPKASTAYTQLDDVKLDYLPECFGPSDVTVSNIIGQSAMVTWRAAMQGVSDYTVEYTVSGQENWQTANAAVVGTRCFLTGLTAQTDYDVRVFSNCTTGSADTATASFTTKCLAAVEATVTNGTQSTFNGLPFNNYYSYSYTQQIYDASEIGEAMTISSIEFEYAYSSPITDKNNVTIYLAHTSQSVFSSSSAWIPIDSATIVYTGPMNFTQGWNKVTLDTAFQYNGTDNLALIVDDNSGAYDGNAWVFRVHATTDYKALRRQVDASNISPTAPGTGTREKKRVNVRFSSCDSMATCVAPNVIVTATDSNSVTLEWVAGNTESAWQIEYKLSSDTVWTSEGTVTSSPYTVQNLVSDADYIFRMRSDCGSDFSNYVRVTASTPCASIAALPYTQNFDAATGTGAGNFISCWYRGTNNSTAYPYTYSTYSHSAPYSLYFYSSSSAWAYAAAPQMASEIEMNNLQVSFYARKTSEAAFFEVGVMTDPNDVTTFEAIGTFSPDQTADWQLGEVNTDTYTGNGRYIAFRTPQWVSGYICLDDVTIQEIPFCGRVEDIEAINVTPNSATITWTPGGNETEWEVCYGLSGTVDPETATAVQTSEDSIALSGLEASSLYDVYVRIVCASGDYGAWTQYSFRTACGQIEAVPFTENFDSYASGQSNFPYCWAKFNNYSTATNYPYVYGTYYYSGNRSLYFYASSTTYNLAILPELSSSLPVNTLRLSFQMRAANANNKMVVGLMTDPNDVTTFEPVDTVAVTAAATWQLVRVPLASYTGNGKYVTIKTCNSAASGFCIDDVVLDLIPDCSAPTDLAVTATSTTADLTWTDDPSQSSWELVYATLGQEPDYENPIVTNTTSYSLTGLQGNSAYQVYVRTNCAGMPGSSDWETVSFVTPSEYPAAVPYFHDFTDTTENNNWALQNGTAVNKWYIAQPTGESKNKLFVSNNGITTDYTINSVSVAWAYRDVMFGSDPMHELSFDWKCVGESNYDYIRVYVGDPALVDAGNVIAYANAAPEGSTMLVQKLNLQSSTQHFSGTIDGTHSNKIRRIFFLWRNDASGGAMPAAVIDSISIVGISCPAPSDLATSNVTSTSVDLSWTPAGNETAWNIEYGPQGFTPGSGTTVAATTNPFTVTGLTTATAYEFYVQASCGAGDVSSWTGPVVAAPGSYNFPTTGTTTLTMCDGLIYDDGGADGNYSTNCDATVVINPATAGNVVKVTGVGTYATESTFDYLVIYDGTDNTGTQLFTTSGTSAGTIPACTSTTGSLTLYFHSDGSVVKSGFALQVSCEAAPTPDPDPDPEPEPGIICEAPANLTVSDVTDNSANLSWTQQGTPDSWTVYFRKGTESWTTVNTTTPSPYALTDLAPESNYEAYVVAVCGDSVSAPSNTVTFSTQPDGIADYVLGQTKLYPNPTSSNVTIVNNNCMIEKVEVYDVYGQTLRVQQVNGNSVVLPAEELAAGMYFVRVITDKGTIVKPFTKR